MPFFRADAGISAGGVDERNDRQPELVRQAHQPKRLAIALRVGRAEVTQNVFFGIVPFLRADHDDLVIAQPRQTADDGPIVGIKPVAVQFGKIGERRLQVIQRVRTLGMPRQLHSLPGSQIGENHPPRFLNLFFNLRRFLLETDAQRMGFGMAF